MHGALVEIIRKITSSGNFRVFGGVNFHPNETPFFSKLTEEMTDFKVGF